VLNGFGKSTGLMQLNELGTVETPILLTNTFAGGACSNALIRRAITSNPKIGRQISTVNPVVLECNDGYLNDIQATAVTEAHANTAIESAAEEFAVGSVGAGTGMSCFGLKGGIGTASRGLHFDRQPYHVGVVVLANFGRAGDLRLPDGRRIDPGSDPAGEAGSCIMVVGPRSRCTIAGSAALRAAPALGWRGAARSEATAVATSRWRSAPRTAHRVPHDADRDLLDQRVLAETRIDRLFQAAAEATQEAVLDALVAVGTMVGRNGHRRIGLTELL
jgi:D-aminopeptidase